MPVTTSLKLTNKGRQEHDFAFRKISDDVTVPFAEIMKNEQSSSAATRSKLLVGWAPGPGTTSYAILDLERGRYGMACFVVVPGTKDEHHFKRGELVELTVA